MTSYKTIRYRTWKPGLPGLLAAAMAGLMVGGCGGAATTKTGEVSVAGDARRAAVEAPGPGATLTVTRTPDGWTYLGEERPPTERGNTVILRFFEGPEVGIPNPGGEVSRLQVVVSATHIPDMIETGRGGDLAELVTGPGPNDWTEVASLTVANRAAVELVRPAGPAKQRLVVTRVGEWRLQASGTAVDTATLRRFMTAAVIT